LVNLFETRYEDLVSDPRSVLEAFGARFGLGLRGFAGLAVREGENRRARENIPPAIRRTLDQRVP
jgi:hypothetical protein